MNPSARGLPFGSLSCLTDHLGDTGLVSRTHKERPKRDTENQRPGQETGKGLVHVTVHAGGQWACGKMFVTFIRYG